MDVVGINVLDALKRKHAVTKSRVESLLAELREGEWTSFQDLRKTYQTASWLGKGLVVFDLGRQFRILVRIAFRTKKLVILRAGTHEEYDGWDIATLGGTKDEGDQDEG